MKNNLQEIVVAEIKRNHQFESDFYEKALGIKQQSWNRWKKGDQGFNKGKMDLIKAYFTDYEWMIVEKLSKQMNMYPQNFDNKPFDQYVKVKKDIATNWAKEAKITVSSSRNVDDPKDGRINPGVKLTISMDYNGWVDSITLYAESGTKIPAGKRNRYEWFMEHVNELY